MKFPIHMAAIKVQKLNKIIICAAAGELASKPKQNSIATIPMSSDFIFPFLLCWSA